MARIDEGKWLGADEQHREWGVRFRFRNGRVAVTALSEEREFVQSRAEWYAGIEDSDAPDGAEIAAVWRQVGPWQAGEPPTDEFAHRVTVTVETVWTGSPDAPERDIEFHHAVGHPAACHLLPYGVPCEFDFATNYGDDHMPGHPGVYTARVVQEDIPDDVDPELAFAEFRVDYERVQQAKDGGDS